MTEHIAKETSTHSAGDSEKDIATQQIEVQRSYDDAVTKKPTFGQKAKRHCARFWWLHLIIFCAIFLIIALCLVYVAMPKIAQKGVNDSSLEFTDLEFLSPTPNSIVLTQKGILHSPSMYTPTLDKFDADLYLVNNGTMGSVPFMTIPMPSIHALHPSSEVTISSQLVQVKDLAGLTDYATQVLSDETVTTALKGKTKLHEGKLPVLTVDYFEQTTYKALNGLKGFNVSDVRINLTAKAGENNLKGFAVIPNPSVMTIEMGNVTLSLTTAAAGVIGNSTINNMTLRPGTNTLEMTGFVDQVLILKGIATTGIQELFVTATEVIYNGEHLTYYETALGSNKLSLMMNVLQVIADSSAKSAT